MLAALVHPRCARFRIGVGEQEGSEMYDGIMDLYDDALRLDHISQLVISVFPHTIVSFSTALLFEGLNSFTSLMLML